MKSTLSAILATTVLAASILAPARAQAQQPVEWKDSWHKVRTWQYPTSVALVGFALTARFALPNPEPNWRGTWEVEQDIVDFLAVRDNPTRRNLLMYTDITFAGSIAYRAFDSIAVPGWFHDSWDVAWQMSWIDFQSFGLLAAVLWGSQLYIGRVRPTANNCDDPTRAGYICDPNDSEYARSFIAGHPATALTAAGLTCLHHQHIPLYGGGLADDLACGVMIGNAVVNAATRLMVEHHYPSDLLFGTVLGLSAGWVLPKALHYGWGDDDEDDTAETAGLPEEQRDATAPVFTVAPTALDGGGGLMVLGRW